ncbi:MAG TPA: N-acetyltransferase [Caulobacteraceae bacterium]|jgi:predicted N-acetyltransferase YhbS|nr:N-acetyltransferase [Caulobacteraceae bacterium]
MTTPFKLVKTGQTHVAPERPQDAEAVERLIARAFGPGRFVKTVERLREGAAPILEVSQVAWLGGRPVGAVRLWPIRIGRARALLLGPIAVDVTCRGSGIGASMVEAACATAEAAGWSLILLVGDLPFFGPLGFVRAPAEVLLPGPVDRRRLLVRPLTAGADAELAGAVAAG